MAKNQKDTARFFIQEGDRRIKLSVSYTNYDRHRAIREDRVADAIEFSKSQRSTTDDRQAMDAGVGYWVLPYSEEANELYYAGYLYMTERTPLNHNKVIKLLKAITPMCLGRDLDARLERQEGINEGRYFDLPVHNVKLLHALKIVLRNVHDNHIHKVALRSAKLLACGQPYDVLKPEGHYERKVTKCKVRGCGNPECVFLSAQRTKARMLKDLNSIKLQEGQRAVYATFAHDWALPKDEERYKNNPLAASEKQLSAKHVFIRNDPSLSDMTGSRIAAHRKVISRVSERLPDNYSIPIRKLEVGWTLSSVSGRRAYPNPHTHAILILPSDVSNEEAARILTAKAKAINNSAHVLIADINLNSNSKQTASYNSKDNSITASDDTQVIIAPTEVNIILDERSIVELAAYETNNPVIFYHSHLSAHVENEDSSLEEDVEDNDVSSGHDMVIDPTSLEHIKLFIDSFSATPLMHFYNHKLRAGRLGRKRVDRVPRRELRELGGGEVRSVPATSRMDCHDSVMVPSEIGSQSGFDITQQVIHQ